jgi:hypothetical protein
MYAQINKRFLILTHFGMNSLGPGNMGVASPSNANGGNGTFFMHDAWAEYSIVAKKLHIGAGLHYWNGLSRLTNQSTLNIMTLDAPLFNWFSIGTSDQFARHLGMYAKGRIGKFDYRVAFNDALGNPRLGRGGVETPNTAYYGNQDGSLNTGKILQGYFNYQFLDGEGNTLPYFVGTYLGGKRVFNVGGGFFSHFQGIGVNDANGNQLAEKEDAISLAFDVFYDAPIGDNNSAITLYGVFYNHSWGENLTGGLAGVGTGNIIYAQAGYVLPTSNPGMLRIQPYASYAHKDINAFDDPGSDLNIGTNLFFDGHHSKLSIEYRRRTNPGATEGTGSLVLQAMVWL